jgi:hypothetical protein
MGKDRSSDVPHDFVVASHDVLFAVSDEVLCDVCGAPLRAEAASEEPDARGRGTYLWARGDDVRLEDVPLCASCASAIGMTALARWEIEEEEG